MDLFNNITRGEYKPVSSRYSPELAKLISSMIVINPTKRLSSAQVFQIASDHISQARKTLGIDSFLTMEDIASKLQLVDYGGFCRLTDHRPIHKLYFALEDKAVDHAQLYYFLEICYWLMALPKLDRSRDKCATQAKSMIDWRSSEDACTKFLKDLSSFGVKTDLDTRVLLPVGSS